MDRSLVAVAGGGYTQTLRRQTNLLIAVVSKFF
ncbi:hypothetical protein J2Z28_003702 [Paenibacillus xylanexedens]|uniref:Histone deacetylase n=1 Tax=Paenibacillus xylanexedens TaxID=528191 RepID=A0ABS4RVY5_PAEXY|nr:hypothetical protein [Paenibacillus xylanexedens]